MPLETCQMLSIVASKKWGHGYCELPKLDGTPYKTEKIAFRNHPCTTWAQQTGRGGSSWSSIVQSIHTDMVRCIVVNYYSTCRKIFHFNTLDMSETF